jgi:hypothetical protein
MARLKIDIKNKDLKRFKDVILSQYDLGEENNIVLDTNEQIIDHLTSMVKEYLKTFVISHERHIKQQQAISGITVDEIDLNE